MRWYNGEIFIDGRFVRGGFTVEKGRFTEVFAGDAPGVGVDLQGARVIPGLVDIHVHGCGGADFSDGEYDGLVTMAKTLAACGVTSFVPSARVLPYEKIEQALSTAVLLRRNLPEGCAWPAAARMEGPFLSGKQIPARDRHLLRDPDFQTLRSLFEFMGGILGMVDVAPELEGAMEFIGQAKEFCTVSLGHTDCDYETATAALAAGATQVTHLFHAMGPVHHRDPGMIAAAAEREDVAAELICDGVRVHPAVVRLAFQLFPGRICMISDGKREGGASLWDGLRNAVSWGVPAEQAVLSATAIPACRIGRDYEVGSIARYKRADFIVCDKAWNPKQVCLGGRLL